VGEFADFSGLDLADAATLLGLSNTESTDA
jgi:hypothetical protein